MAYKMSEYRWGDLPQETRYRFAEIEINRALNTLSRLFQLNYSSPYNMAYDMIETILFIPQEKWQYERAWEAATKEHYFRRPVTADQINYFLYHQKSYKTIQTLLRVAPNTISKFRYQRAPMYFPIFQHWTPEMLNRWNKTKVHLNLWNEQLTHSPENEQEPKHYIQY